MMRLADASFLIRARSGLAGCRASERMGTSRPRPRGSRNGCHRAGAGGRGLARGGVGVDGHRPGILLGFVPTRGGPRFMLVHDQASLFRGNCGPDRYARRTLPADPRGVRGTSAIATREQGRPRGDRTGLREGRRQPDADGRGHGQVFEMGDLLSFSVPQFGLAVPIHAQYGFSSLSVKFSLAVEAKDGPNSRGSFAHRRPGFRRKLEGR